MSSPRAPDPLRRSALERLLNDAIAAVFIGSGLHARFAARRRLVVERHTLPLAALPPALAGLRLVQLSDLHFGPYSDARYLSQVIEAAAALEPDLVALTGDFIEDRSEVIHQLAPLLAELTPRYGSYASLGNHDVNHDPGPGAPRIRRTLEAHGITVLVNEGVTVTVAGAPLHLVGLDSGWGGHPDMQRALAAHPEGAPVIALVHEPDLIDGLAADERIALQLSGHSHGGQIRLPGIGAPLLPYLGRRYDLGLYRVGKTWLYVNRGIGLGWLPLRLNCPAEIAEFTLVAGSATSEPETTTQQLVLTGL